MAVNRRTATDRTRCRVVRRRGPRPARRRARVALAAGARAASAWPPSSQVRGTSPPAPPEGPLRPRSCERAEQQTRALARPRPHRPSRPPPAHRHPSPTGRPPHPRADPDTKQPAARPAQARSTRRPVAGPDRDPDEERQGDRQDRPRDGRAPAGAGRSRSPPRCRRATSTTSPAVCSPESQDYPHQGVGWDHDSVGLFQQRSSSGWGAVGELMDPEFATRQFLTALARCPAGSGCG